MNSERYSSSEHDPRWLAGAAVVVGPTDEQLLQRYIAQRDETAFEALVQRHGPLVWGACRRTLADVHEAEDAFQATFLLLARKASSIVKRESIRSWLYGVAYRTARDARAQVRARQKVQRVLTEADAAPATPPSTAAAWEQLKPVLDEELNRLPEKLKAPLLLCYLDGKTRDEAAQELGWTVGMVKGCLEHGRDLLRARLGRRVLGLSAALLPALLEENALAAVPPVLKTSTVQAALGGTVSAPVAALVKGGLSIMWFAKMKTAALLFLSLGCLGTALGVAGYQVLANEDEADPKDKVEDKQPAAPEGGSAVNGLRLTLSADQTETVMKADGSNAEPVKLKLTFTNVSDKPIKLANSAFWSHCELVDLAGPDAQSIQVKAAANVLGIEKTDPQVIQPGQSWIQSTIQVLRDTSEITFPGLVHQRTTNHYHLLKPGEYRFKWKYFNEESDYTRKEGSWTGTLTSNELVLKVLPEGGKASAPAVKDGLEVIVKPTKTIFAADEKPAFEITYTNRTDKVFCLYDLGYEVNHFLCIDLGDNGPWKAGPWERGIRQTQLVQLDAGKSCVRKHALRGPFTWKGNQAMPVPPRDALRPGTYRLTAMISFPNDGLPEVNLDLWKGEITANPVEFEIAAPKAGGK